jgi:predicted MFS family arabinose efflux permease
VLVTYRGDRFGKYRSLLVSTAGSALIYMLLPLLSVALWTTMIGLLIIRITFESSMVSNISLLSEQSPTQRGRVLTLFSAAVTVGAAGASFTGPYLYSHWGIVGLAAASAGMAVAAAILILARVEESETEEPETELDVEQHA